MPITPDGGPGCDDPVLPPEQRERLRGLLGAPVEVLEQVGSTNDELVRRVEQARRRGAELPELTLLTTRHQSAGRGRLDRTWISAPGEALTFSVLLRPAAAVPRPLPLELCGWLTMLMAVAVAETLRAAEIPATVKWPNDVLVGSGVAGDPKICGILAALAARPDGPPDVVLGAGLNVAEPVRPVPGAASVHGQGARLGRGELLVRIMERFCGLYHRFLAEPAALTDQAGPLRARLEPLLSTLGAEVTAQLPGDRAPVRGRAAGLDDQGSLIVETGAVRQDGAPLGGRVSLRAADIVHLRRADDGAATPAAASSAAAEGG